MDLGLTLTSLPTQLFKSGPLTGDAADSTDIESLNHLVGRALHVYQCRSLLGRGGMGWVYLAQHRDLGRDCALKILSPKLVEKDPNYLQSFWNEGRAAASLVHPNIVTIHAVGESDGHHFLEMEFVRGQSLQHLIDDAPLSPLKATSIICQIAEGLSAAHRAGILHRDLKPDNILLTHRGIAKIGDFGLAKRVHASTANEFPEALAGTPHFMAPELFQGAGATPASDVYSLGICYFLLLTGRLPFARRSLNELMSASLSEPLPRIDQFCHEATPEMAYCLNALTARSPANRPQSGLEACSLLQAVLGHLRDVETLMHDAFDPTPGVTWTREQNRFELKVPLPDGRNQTVYVESSDHASQHSLLTIFSRCCPVQPHYFEQALRLNAEISHGAISIREVNGQSFFVMVDTYPSATVDAEEIRQSVFEIAKQADFVEDRLTGRDVH
ncbi:MAG: protein kinase [Planctomycetaceae bacterium]